MCWHFFCTEHYMSNFTWLQSLLMKLLNIILIYFLSVGIAFGQSDKSDIEQINYVVLELFDAYRAGDSARVAAGFSKGAEIQTLHMNNEGKVELSGSKPVSVLLDYIGNGLSQVHDERLWDTTIHSDGLLATVWTKYAFFIGKTFIHCGSETILLKKEENKWKIFYLADTRQTKGCKLPSSIK